MIDQTPGSPIRIYVGDGDVLMGFTPGSNLARVWFAPLPEGTGLKIGEVTRKPTTDPPDNAVVEVYFLNLRVLTAFIGGLTRTLERTLERTLDKMTATESKEEPKP